MADWTERERQRAELIACLDEAEASILRGDGIEIADDAALDLVFDEIETECLARGGWRR